MSKKVRRENLGLGKTAAGGNGGSWATHVREGSPPPPTIAQMYQVASAPRTADEDYQRAMEHVRARVSYIQGTNWDDREDIVQDTMIELVKRSRQHGWTNLSDGHSAGGNLGVVDLTVKSMIVRSQHPGEHHTTVRGRKEFEQQRDLLEQQHGRLLREEELSDLAEHVRLSYPPGRRPAAGYHVGAPQLEPLDPNSQIAAGSYVDSYNIGGPRSAGFANEPDLPGEHGKLKAAERATAQKSLWADLARQDPDIPSTYKLSSRERARSAAVLAEAGGVHFTAFTLSEGESVSPAVEEAFYAPWGGVVSLTYDQQLAVAEKVAEHPTYSERLWLAAAK